MIKEISDIVEKIQRDNLTYFGIKMDEKKITASILIMYLYYSQEWYKKVPIPPESIIKEVEGQLGIHIPRITTEARGLDGKIYKVSLLRDKEISDVLRVAPNYLQEAGLIDRPLGVWYKVQNEGGIPTFSRYK